MTKVVFNKETQQKVVAGIQTLANAVRITLGPQGKNVILDKKWVGTHLTKDGVSVAREVECEDHYENIACRLGKEAAEKTVEQCGDGTTTCTILLESIVSNGMRHIQNGNDPASIKRGIDKAVALVVAEIKKQAKPISEQNKEELLSVATISANGDKEIGKMISDVLSQVGKNGIVTIETSKKPQSKIRKANGFELQSGFATTYFINNEEKQNVVFDDCAVLLVQSSLVSQVHLLKLLPVLEYCSKNSRPLLLISDNVDGDFLSTLIENVKSKALKVVAVNIPGFDQAKRDSYEDLASITGATLRMPTVDPLLNLSPDELGSVKRLEVFKDRTLLVAKDEAKDLTAQHVLTLQKKIATEEGRIKEQLQDRLAKLQGGVAVIEVGGANELEMKERKDRFDDALSATKSALEEGIVAGGGCALLKARSVLKRFLNTHNEESLGIQVVYDSCSAPLKQLIENAGTGNEAAFGYVVFKCENPKKNHIGYNARTMNVCDSFKEGIIDPAKVVRCSLENAANIGSLLLTTNVMISETGKDKE